MKKLTLIIFILLSAISLAGAEKEKVNSVSMVAATSIKSQLPFAAYGEGKWESEEGAEFVKLHAYFDSPISFQMIELTGCGGDFIDDVSMFINFDEMIETIFIYGKSKLKYDMEREVSARSITLNFNKNNRVCVESIQLFNSKGEPIAIKTPLVVEGNVSASSTLQPDDSYGVMNIFDSRYEYAWASDAKPKNVALKFTFKEAKTITKIKIWNGYQRSDRHCIENARAQKIVLKGLGGYEQAIQIKDTMGPQEITLPKPFHGASLTMTIAESYQGRTYKDLVISELRFYDGENWFLVNPISKIKATSKKITEAMSNAGAETLLNKRLLSYDGWDMRFRSDGSFYIDGESYEGDLYKFYIGLGNFQVKSSDAQGVHVKVYGLLRTYEEEWGEMDCNGCARDCNAVFNPTPEEYGSSSEEIFSEHLFIQNDGEVFIIQNESKNPKLPFDEMEAEIQ